MTATAVGQLVGPPAAPRTMPLGDHLREASRRALWAAVALAVGTIAGWILSDAVMEVLRTPVEQLAATRSASLNYDSLTGAFDLKLKVAVVTGVVLSSPVWLFQLLAFLVPGLTRRERRYTLGFTGAAVVLFAAGCVTGLLLFPHMVELLTSFASAEDTTILSASYYLDFVLKMVVAMGTAFVLPVVLVLLNLVGILPATTIARTWRVSVIGIVLFSALVTPAADVLSLFLVAVPMTTLFLTALGIAALHDRAEARRAASVLS